MDHRYLFAAAYGNNAYGCGRYDVNESCETTSPLAPATGFFNQPPYIVLPVLLLIAVAFGTIAYFVARKLRKKRH